MTRWLPLVMAVLLMACGGESGEVKSAVQEFADAAEDPERTCALITARDRAELEKLATLTGGGTCADAAKLIDAESGSVNLEDVKVEGDRATVQETLTATTFTLRREGGKWRVDMLALAHLGWTLRQSIACSQFVADAQKLGEPGDSRRALTSYMRRYEGLSERWAADAATIKPPRMYAKRHRELMAGIGDFRRAARGLRTAVGRGEGIDRAYKDLETAEGALKGFPITCGASA